jgi:hypothetical protein
MKYRRRVFFTDQQKAEIWDRWQRGESMSSIGRGFERNSSSIYPLLARTGGIRPPDRVRSRLALTLGEREEISRSLHARQSLRSIARALRRSASTISREVGRNGGAAQYRATPSDQAAWDRAQRPKPCKLAGSPYLCRAISVKLTRKWSPQQIAGWLMREHPDDAQMRVSHETIYRSLFIQARGVLKKELLAHLRAKRSIRRSRHASLKGDGLGQIKDALSIRDRPASVEDRAVPGHWPYGDASIAYRLAGRRPDRRIRQQLHRHAGGAPVALRHAGEGRQQGHAERDDGPHQAVKETPARALPIPHLGPGNRDVRSSTLHARDGHRGLPLRSAKPVAAWHKRIY